MSSPQATSSKPPGTWKGADILLLHNAGEMLAWPDNIAAFSIIFEAAGLSWTLSSEIAGYDSVNYGIFYDDVQAARVALKHAEAAKKLGVKQIVLGECGTPTRPCPSLPTASCRRN